MTKKIFFFLILVITLGLLIRLYLVITLPVWFDEYVSLTIANHSWQEVIKGSLDFTHPPGYYLFLKSLLLFSPNIIWLRFSSLFFYVINSVLLFSIGKKFKNLNFGLILTTLYSLSGYFIIFDWQSRMYTLLVTLILSSYLLLIDKGSKQKLAILFLVNILGLFLDYGFLFYFLPLTFWLLIRSNTKKYSFLLSFLLFAGIWGNTFLINLKSGEGGIAWIAPFTTPSFFVPYFLGSHLIMFFTIVFLLLLSVGAYKIIKDSDSQFLKILIGIASFSLVFNMIFSDLVKPILHVRSLQIVGISVLFLYSQGLLYLYKHSKIVVYLYLLLFVVNILFIVFNFRLFAGSYLIRFDKPV